MTTVTLGTPEVEAVIARRRALGHDRRDEQWGDRYFMAPHATTAHSELCVTISSVLRLLARPLGLVTLGEHNLGTGPKRYVVPDGAVVRFRTPGVYQETALLVVEVLSPGDDTPFKVETVFGSLGVVEVLLADPATATLQLLRHTQGAYLDVDRSEVLGVTVTELAQQIDWPEGP